MGGFCSRRWAPVLAGLLGLMVLVSLSTPASAGNVTACGDYSSSPDTRFDIVNNITHDQTSGACLQFHSNSVIFLNGHVISGLSKEYTDTVGITISNDDGDTLAGDAFILGFGIIRHFGTAILAGSDVAVENVLIHHVHGGISLHDSYKIKEVRIRNCTTSAPDDYGMSLGQGGFIESSIVRDCEWGVRTWENNKIWNLVVSKHLYTGLEVFWGNAVSRTVISSPRSYDTIGLYYICSGGGCADGSNSVQDHCTPGLSLLCPQDTDGPFNNGRQNIVSFGDVITDGATNCGGAVIPHSPVSDEVTANC